GVFGGMWACGGAAPTVGRWGGARRQSVGANRCAPRCLPLHELSCPPCPSDLPAAVSFSKIAMTLAEKCTHSVIACGQLLNSDSRHNSVLGAFIHKQMQLRCARGCDSDKAPRKYRLS